MDRSMSNDREENNFGGRGGDRFGGRGNFGKTPLIQTIKEAEIVDMVVAIATSEEEIEEAETDQRDASTVVRLATCHESALNVKCGLFQKESR